MVLVRFFLVIPAKAGIHSSPSFRRKPGSICFSLDLPQHPTKPDSRPCGVCPPSLAASHFLLLAQEKVTKEKGTLAAAVTRASMPA